MASETHQKIYGQLIDEFNATNERRALEIAASDPNNWRVINSKPMYDDFQLQGDIAAANIDAAIMSLIDLAPERLGWDVLALCEVLINSHIETHEHLSALMGLLELLPQALHEEARVAIGCLMKAAGREVASFNPPACIDLKVAQIRGWIVA